jgi:hypothetical protein
MRMGGGGEGMAIDPSRPLVAEAAAGSRLREASWGRSSVFNTGQRSACRI